MMSTVSSLFVTPLNLAVNAAFLTVLCYLTILNYIKRICAPFLRVITAKHHPATVRNADKNFAGLAELDYNFAPNYFTFPMGGGVASPRVHFLDEGPRDSTETVVLLHGEPSWSFLYRKMIPPLVDAGYRVVVPDFIGFGKSDKYTAQESYTHELHTTTLRFLFDELSLDNVTLVVQDWGGLTGLSVMPDMPARFARVVIMNTGLPVGENLSLTPSLEMLNRLSAALPFLVWRNAVELLGPSLLPIGLLFKWLAKFPEAVVEGYTAPFPDKTYKAGAAQWPLMVPVFRDSAVTPYMAAARKFLRKSWDKPTLVMFSDKDPITKGQDAVFMGMIKGAESKTIRGAGHFLQETHGAECAENIIKFIGSGSASGSGSGSS